jgi:ribosomal protein S21
MKVICQEGKFEQGLRKFKKKVVDSGLLQTLREREFYTKPSVEKKIAKGKARNRWRKHLSSQELPKKLY